MMGMGMGMLCFEFELVGREEERRGEKRRGEKRREEKRKRSIYLSI